MTLLSGCDMNTGVHHTHKLKCYTLVCEVCAVKIKDIERRALLHKEIYLKIL